MLILEQEAREEVNQERQRLYAEIKEQRSELAQDRVAISRAQQVVYDIGQLFDNVTCVGAG